MPFGSRAAGVYGLTCSGIVDPLVGPEAGDRDDPAVDLADRAQVLAGDVRGLGAGLPIAAVVDHQHPVLVRRRRGVGHQQLQPPTVDRLGVPGRLGEEELEPLDGWRLRPDDRLGPDQAGQRLVPITRQQQPLQVLPKAAPLGERAQAIVELARVLFEWPRGGRTRQSLRHGGASASRPPHDFRPHSTNYR